MSNKPISMRSIHYLLYFIQSDWKNSSKTISEPGKGDLFLKEKDSSLTIRERESLTSRIYFNTSSMDTHMASSNLTIIRVYHKICSRLNSRSTPIWQHPETTGSSLKALPAAYRIVKILLPAFQFQVALVHPNFIRILLQDHGSYGAM